MKKELKIIIPQFIQNYVFKIIWDIRKRKFKKIVLDYYQNNPSDDDEINKSLDFLKNNKFNTFPYEFIKDYNFPVDVLYNKNHKVYYVIHEGKKLFFKKGYSKRQVAVKYRMALLEQDEKSAHKYLTEDFDVNSNDIVADVGIAEGLFSLEIVEKVKKMYIFEPDPEWIKVLRLTFAPWKDKVTIVPKFVGNKNDSQFVSIDEYFKDKDMLTFFKIDVDGGERDLLKGMQDILKGNANLKLALCTYHFKEDEDEFKQILVDCGFDCEVSKNYMLFPFEKEYKAPYYRRGLIRAKRN